MKKYIIFGLFISMLVGLLIWLYWPQSKLDEIIIISQSHYILYDEDQTVDVKFFTSKENVIQTEDILSGFIQNEDESLKFMIESLVVDKIHNERLDDKLYFGYVFKIKLPNIEGSYDMALFYLRLNIKDVFYGLFAGRLYVEYPTTDDQYIPWYGIEGIKGRLPILSQIIIDVHEFKHIDSIWVGPHEVTYFTGIDNIVLNIEPNRYVFDTTFVKIMSGDLHTYVPNFTYFMNYELLSSGIHQSYVIM